MAMISDLQSSGRAATMLPSEEVDLELENESEVYRKYLEANALSASVILEDVRQGRPFKTALLGASGNAGVLSLSEEEIESVLDVKVVGWESFRSRLLDSVAKNCASTKSSVSHRTKMHLDNLFCEMDSLGSAENLPSFIKPQDTVKRRANWKAHVDVIAAEFARILETRLSKGDAVSIEEQIATILDSDWHPEDRAHEETIYYVCGYLMRRLKNAAAKCNNKQLKQALEEIVANGTTVTKNS